MAIDRRLRLFKSCVPLFPHCPSAVLAVRPAVTLSPATVSACIVVFVETQTAHDTLYHTPFTLVR